MWFVCQCRLYVWLNGHSLNSFIGANKLVEYSFHGTSRTQCNKCCTLSTVKLQCSYLYSWMIWRKLLRCMYISQWTEALVLIADIMSLSFSMMTWSIIGFYMDSLLICRKWKCFLQCSDRTSWYLLFRQPATGQ